jgi:hypothetical protein
LDVSIRVEYGLALKEERMMQITLYTKMEEK